MSQDEVTVWSVAGILLVLCILVIRLQNFNSRPLFSRPYSKLQNAAFDRLAEEQSPWGRLDASHPMKVLAEKVGVGAKYPVRRNYRVSRLLVLMLPGLIPLIFALLTSSTAQNVSLMFAGAFFGTFAASFWPKYVNRIDKFWQLARQQDRPPGEMLAMLVKFAGQKEWVSASNSGGYSHLGRVAARIKFEILARTWSIFFIDVMRVRLEGFSGNPGAAAVPKWRYSRMDRYNPNGTYRTGRPWWFSIFFPYRLIRLALSRSASWIEESNLSYALTERIAEALLRVVAVETVKATGRQSDDIYVLTLSLQLGLFYSRPDLSRRWVAVPLGQDEPWKVD